MSEIIPLNRTAMLMATGIAGALIIGYCVYFDKKRRTDPEYRRKLHETRLRKLLQQRQRKKLIKTVPIKELLKELPDKEAIEHYFLKEMQAAEALLARNECERGAERFTNAFHVCSEPDKLLEVLADSLSPAVLDLLRKKIEEVSYTRALYTYNEANGVKLEMVRPDFKAVWDAQFATYDELD